MLVCYRFFPETFDVNKTAIVFIRSITLTAHTTRALLLQHRKVIADDLACRLLTAFRHVKGHDVPYHNRMGFGFYSRSLHGNRSMKNAAPDRYSVAEMGWAVSRKWSVFPGHLHIVYMHQAGGRAIIKHFCGEFRVMLVHIVPEIQVPFMIHPGGVIDNEDRNRFL